MTVGQGSNKRVGRYALVCLALLGAAWGGYLAGGHRLVTAMYDQSGPGWLNGFMQYRGSIPLETYLRKADIWFGIASVALAVGMVVVGYVRYAANRRRARKLCFVAGYVVMLLALAEVTARVYFWASGVNIEVYQHMSYGKSYNLFEPDDLLEYHLIANAHRRHLTSDYDVIYETNSVALRDKAIEDTGKYRIVFLGDSLTFGEGVPFGKRFSDLVGQEVPGVQTINAGVGGYGLHQMTRWFAQRGVKLHPDLVVCCINNLVFRRAAYSRARHTEAPHLLHKPKAPGDGGASGGSDGGGPALSVGGELGKLGSAVLMRSHLYAYAAGKIKIAVMASQMRQRDKKIWAELTERSTQQPRTRDEVLEQVGEELMTSLQAAAADAGARLLVLNIDKSMYPWAKEIIQRHKIEYLDLTEPLSAATGLSFEIDPHYNAKGNRLIADHLERYLKDRYAQRIAAGTKEGR